MADDQDASGPGAGEFGSTPEGLDPTRDPQKPGPPKEPRDSRQAPPSSISDSGTSGGGVAGTPSGGERGRDSGPDESGGGPEPL